LHRCDEAVHGSSVYLLQRYSQEWSQFIDVEGILDIEGGAHLKVVPLPSIVKKPEVGTCFSDMK
jgi:hypothetical protein